MSDWRRPVAEFVAIFAGISLSLVAEDWRQSRLDSVEQESALQMILEDLARDSSAIESALGYGRRHEAVSYWVTHHWDDPNIPADSAAAVLRQTMFIGDVQLSTAAYSSLKEANRLALVENDSLRAKIVSYYEETQPSFDGWAEAVWDSRLGFLDRVFSYVLQPLPDSPGRGWPASGPMRLLVPWAEITKDPLIYNLMFGYGATAAVMRLNGDSALEANNDLRAAIKQVLGGA